MSPQFYRARGSVLMARIRIQQSRLHLQKTRLFNGRTLSTRPKSRLPYEVIVAFSSQKMHPYRRRIFKAVLPLRPQNWRSVLASAIQFNSTLAQADDCPPLPQSEPTTDLKQSGKFRLCI